MKTIVKHLSFLMMMVFFSHCEKEPTSIIIPDDNFLQALLDLGIDTDGNGAVSPAEAEAITFLDVSGKNISDLKGIEAFINLKTLYCRSNLLSSLNVSKNTELELLELSDNQITLLDVSNNVRLNHLICWKNRIKYVDLSNNSVLETVNFWGNQLASLDVSENSSLEYLFCFENQLSSLDVNNNDALIELDCSRNQITTLDISQNTVLEKLYLTDMPSLNKVCVWIMPFPPSGVTVYMDDSPNINFTDDCGY